MSQSEQSVRVERAVGSVVVKHHDAVIAASKAALVVHGEREAPIYYLPRQDVYFEQMTAAELPGRGAPDDRSWFSVTASGGGLDHAAWVLRQPEGELAAVEGYVGFDPDKLSVMAD